MKRKHREAMRAADALKQYESAPRRYPRQQPPAPMGEPWCPVMSERERQAHEQYVKDNNLPF